MSKFKLAVLNSHPIQYFAPFYAYLNGSQDIEVTALYMSDFSLRGSTDRGFGQRVVWDLDLLAGYPNLYLGGAASRRAPGGFWSLVVPQVWREVREGGYDALLIHGHAYAANLIAMAAAKSIGLPVLVKGETHLGLPVRRLKRVMRRPVMGAFYAFCDRALAIGSANAAFYRAMGVPENRIFLAPYTVDNDRFMAMAKLPPQERLAVRERLGIKATSPAILYAGKFTQRKHPDHLLQAAARLRDQTEQPFTVVMCGAGEMEAELRAYCEEHPSLDVIFAGFVNQAELPKLYAACDIFSLPSESEPWGLTVNEAMCAGLPVVVSREVGSVADLVVDGLNGFTPEAGDIDALTTALKRLVEDASFRQRAAKASFDRISNWGYRETADGLRAAINSLASRTS